MSDLFLNHKDVGQIPRGLCPMVVFCNGYLSIFGYAISVITGAFWTHCMWLVSPEEYASQWWWFKRFPVNHFVKYSLKLVCNPRWTDEEKSMLQEAISNDLSLSKWSTRYDIIGILGEALKLKWLNAKSRSFCSERMSYLALVDPEYAKFLEDNPSPQPEDINTWMKAQKNSDGTPRYVVYARIMPEEEC